MSTFVFQVLPYSPKTPHKIKRRAEPRYGERVRYVVVHGPPGARLVDVVVPPETLVEAGEKLRLHGLYYIAKQINPALERVFGLLGADVRAWFAQLPRPSRLLPQKRPPPALLGEASAGGGASTGTIDRYYLSRHCAICDQLTAAASAICERCAAEPSLAAGVLLARQARLDARYRRLVRLCTHCGGDGGWSRAHDGA